MKSFDQAGKIELKLQLFPSYFPLILIVGIDLSEKIRKTKFTKENARRSSKR